MLLPPRSSSLLLGSRHVGTIADGGSYCSCSSHAHKKAIYLILYDIDKGETNLLIKILLFLSKHILQIIAYINDLSYLLLLILFLLHYSYISDMVLGIASPPIPLLSS